MVIYRVFSCLRIVCITDSSLFDLFLYPIGYNNNYHFYNYYKDILGSKYRKIKSFIFVNEVKMIYFFY